MTFLANGKKRLKRITMPDFGKRIAILIPHPDDEVVACAATIGRAQETGAQIFGLHLTNGCIARETLWPWQRGSYPRKVERRKQESDVVAAQLHITPLVFSDRPARHLWSELASVYNEIRTAIEANGIDQIWTPAYEGGNADHDALNALASRFADTLSVLEFAEYNFAQGKPQAQTFPFPNGQETVVTLTETEQQTKRALLDLYASEKRNLGYVGTAQECYRPLAPYDYTLPAHGGTLWYTRFQWVPFAHPRVDFTKPQDVCAAISSFLP